MLDTPVHSKKWHRMLMIVAQYPAIDLTRQYKYLVFKRLFVANTIAFLLQCVCLMISTLLPLPSPVWFSTGTACAMIFLRGYRVSTGIWLGCFFSYYLVFHQVGLSFAFATIFLGQSILLRWITLRYINPTLVFNRVNHLLKFSISSGILTSIASFMLIEFCNKPYLLWPQWWLANLNGILIIAIGWVSIDTLYTYGGKSFGTHILWCKTVRWAFFIAVLLNLVFYLKLPWITSMTLSTMILLQLLLCLGTLSGLFISLNPSQLMRNKN